MSREAYAPARALGISQARAQALSAALAALPDQEALAARDAGLVALELTGAAARINSAAHDDPTVPLAFILEIKSGQ